jgi:hypothetical protein
MLSAKELIAKIKDECRYGGSNRTESKVYCSAITAACTVIKRELQEDD